MRPRRIHPLDALRDRGIARVRPDVAARLRWRGEPAAPVVRALMRPGDVVVDIGASIGVHAYAYARLVGPRGHVHAFEPHPAHHASLRRLAGMSNATVHHVALSDADGEAELRSPVVNGRAIRALASLGRPSWAASGELESVRVPLRRLDDVLPDSVLPSFLKCDVEGHEDAVLAGAAATIRRAMPIMLIEIEQRHRGQDVAATFALTSTWGYTAYGLRDGRAVAVADLRLERQAALAGDPLAGAAPRDYVHDFLFMPPGRPLPAGLRGAG